MTWIPFAVGAWLLCSVVFAVVVGLSIQIADRRTPTSRWEDSDVLVDPGTPAVRVPALQV
jgi:hypothetical protein